MLTQENAYNKSSEFWGICCEGGKKYSQVVRQKFHITMAALDPTVVPTSPVVSLMVDRGGCEYLLCSLKPGSILQVNLNLYFDKGEKVTFSLKGQGKIHLSGYHIYEKKDPVSSETEEKNIAASPATKKPQVEKSPVKVQDQSKTNSENNKSALKKAEETKKGSKKAEPPKKKASKVKQSMNESEEDSDDEDPFEDLEDEDDDSDEDEESDDDEESEVSGDDSKKDAEKLKSYKRLWSSLTQSDDEEESDNSEDEEENEKVAVKKGKMQSNKKSKIEAPVLNKKDGKNTPGKSAEVINLDDEPKQGKKTPKKDDLLNSSIGRTPMPKKKTPLLNKSNNLSPKKVSFDVDEDSSDSNEEMDASASPSKQGQLTPPSSETKKKKKKKKKKNALDTSVASDEGSNKVAKAGLASAIYSQKLPGGLEYEDIRPGNGPLAKKGKLVHVYYTGMLDNNKVFDSRQPGTKPFSFKLGADQVIKGWDVAIEGMKVGGKRRMKIPPSLGYKNQRMGPIPPNSTLYFTVELKAVS